MTHDARALEVRAAPSVVESMSRALVLASALLAFAAHATLVSSAYPWLWVVSTLVFVGSFVVARWSFAAAAMPAMLLAYLAPAMLALVTGAFGHDTVVVWLAAVAGPVYAVSDWRRWHTPAWWGVAVVAWALILALTWPVIALREIDFSLVAATTLNTPNGLAAPPPPLTAAAVVLATLGQLVGLLWLDTLWARFGSRRLLGAERVIASPLVASIAIASLVGIAQKAGDLTWLSAEPWPRLGRAAGTMLDANSFGTAAAVWATLALLVNRRVGLPLPAGAALVALLAAGMWVSGSRTALLIFVVGALSLMVASLKGTSTWRRRGLLIGVFAGGAMLVGALAGARSADPSSPLARVLATVPSPEEGGVSRLVQELWDRNGYGVAAGRALAEHPWTGVGAGAFSLLATDFFFVERGTLIPPDNAQNWWRHQLAELGVLGATPSILVSAGILAMLLRGRAGAGVQQHVTLLRGTLLGIGLAGLLGVGTQHPALFLTFATLVFWLGAALGLDLDASYRAPRRVWMAVVALAVFVTLGQAYSATRTLRVPHRAVAHGFVYAYGVSEPEPHARLGTARRLAPHAVAVIPAEHAYFRLSIAVPYAAPDAPVSLKLWRNGTIAVDQQVATSEPFVRYVAAPAASRQLMLEFEVSPPPPDARAPMLAGAWFREVPPGTASAAIVP